MIHPCNTIVDCRYFLTNPNSRSKFHHSIQSIFTYSYSNKICKWFTRCEQNLIMALICAASQANTPTNKRMNITRALPSYFSHDYIYELKALQ